MALGTDLHTIFVVAVVENDVMFVCFRVFNFQNIGPLLQNSNTVVKYSALFYIFKIVNLLYTSGPMRRFRTLV